MIYKPRIFGIPQHLFKKIRCAGQFMIRKNFYLSIYTLKYGNNLYYSTILFYFQIIFTDLI